jgi:hypothetical protein
MARCERVMILGREVSFDASLPLVTGQYKGNRNLDWSDENSAGLIVLLEGWDNITQSKGRGPASVTRFKADEEVSIAAWLETERNKFGTCREPYIAQPSSLKR